MSAWTPSATGRGLPEPGPADLAGRLLRTTVCHRVVAVRDRWLISDTDEPEPDLSFLLAGHIAVKAWERTSAQARTPASSVADTALASGQRPIPVTSEQPDVD